MWGSFQTMKRTSPLSNVKLLSVACPYSMTTDQTLYKTLTSLQNSTLNQIMRGFHRTIVTDMACRLGTVTPLEPNPVPVEETCIVLSKLCSTCWDQSSSRTCRYFSRLCTLNFPRYFLNFPCYLTMNSMVLLLSDKLIMWDLDQPMFSLRLYQYFNK